MVHLASRFPVGGLILLSPVASALRVALPLRLMSLPFDAFDSVKGIRSVEAAVLVVHGTADETVPVAHARMLVRRARRGVPPLWVVGGGHNDLLGTAHRGVVLARLRDFWDGTDVGGGGDGFGGAVGGGIGGGRDARPPPRSLGSAIPSIGAAATAAAAAAAVARPGVFWASTPPGGYAAAVDDSDGTSALGGGGGAKEKNRAARRHRVPDDRAGGC
ncbi:hypothetical protein I4F81_001604 [Pyropia yezoensis]|uniref:Uncharacterized protein n=1 Tax=Pyropia yezoensis TaxID=2788 RepID=A0ACC3BM16_PYRYE|nr:hypothetical protein I4F81_001604 [Neopyropia yezoensis]